MLHSHRVRGCTGWHRVEAWYKIIQASTHDQHQGNGGEWTEGCVCWTCFQNTTSVADPALNHHSLTHTKYHGVCVCVCVCIRDGAFVRDNTVFKYKYFVEIYTVKHGIFMWKKFSRLSQLTPKHKFIIPQACFH